MRNDEKNTLIRMIIFMIIIPFCLSIWSLASSGAVNELFSIIFSNNKVLGSFLMCFAWIMGIGMVSEFIKQSEKCDNS
ncbi:MAG: hypothetical protein QM487_02375 [Candidatus Marithrix sp.]